MYLVYTLIQYSFCVLEGRLKRFYELPSAGSPSQAVSTVVQVQYNVKPKELLFILVITTRGCILFWSFVDAQASKKVCVTFTSPFLHVNVFNLGDAKI